MTSRIKSLDLLLALFLELVEEKTKSLVYNYNMTLRSATALTTEGQYRQVCLLIRLSKEI